MLQRIQTLYLFAVLAMFVAMLISPIAQFTNGTENFDLAFSGILSSTGEQIVSTIILSALEIIIALIALVTIFLFKKRMIQIRLSIFNIVLMIGFYAMFFVYVYVASTYSNLESTFKISVLFPLISAVLTYLAIRAIGKDEALVRSLNRIR